MYFLSKYEGFIEASYNLHNKLLVSAYFNYRSEVRCPPFYALPEDFTLPGYKDLGAKIQYNIIPNIAVFAKAGNLLGSENFIYSFIGGLPRNFGGGICIDF